MGIDIGSMYAKGVIIDEYNNIISSSYMETYGNPIKAVKKIILKMRDEVDLDRNKVVSVGVTGSAKKLIGTLLDAQIIKNEITAMAVGTITMYPDVKTILEIGGEDAKIVIVKDGVVVDYMINTSCNAGVGSFISSMAYKLDVSINDVSKLAFNSKNKVNIANRCAVFAKSDLINKIQNGYRKEDVLAGICEAVAQNYVNTVAKGKKIMTPIVFNGGVSKNLLVVKYLEDSLGEKIIVNRNSHIMGAIGIAIMAKNCGKIKEFDFDVDKYNLETKVVNCVNCTNNCEIVTVYRNNSLIDAWGNKCEEVLKNI